MHEDAFEAGHVHEPGQVSLAEAVVICLGRELGRLDVNPHPVASAGNGGLPFHFDAFDGVEGHVLGEATVAVLDGVAAIFSIDIEMADGVVFGCRHPATSQCDEHGFSFFSAKIIEKVGGT